MVKEIDLRRRSRLEQVDDPLGLGRMMEAVPSLRLEHVGQCDSAQASPESLQETSAVKSERGFESRAFG